MSTYLLNHKTFQRGSEWGKWDLHIHTPVSILNNSFGNDWDLYVQRLFKSAIENKVVAIGITDYFSIDGYKKLKSDYLQNHSKLEALFDETEIEIIKNILVIPNIEFRISKLVVDKENALTWNRKVNYHIIFSDKLQIDDIEENFLHRLEFENTALVGESSQTNSLTRRNLELLGTKLKQEHQPFQTYDDYFVGVMNAAIDDKKIIDTLSANINLFKGKYLLGIPADEDLSRIEWNSQGHLFRKLLIKKSHFIFSSNPSTIKFGIGEYHQNHKSFIDEFSSLKPCLWGSDAHSFEKLFKPDLNRYTWIKSNPTFEGLKQVVYEPDQRAKIDENKPFDKTSYLVIDKFRFIDNSSKKIFPPTWIYLNQDLNVIIGGKSAGKSLLIYHLAQAIDKNQVENKTSLVAASDYADFKKENPFNLEVVWRDETINKLTDDAEATNNQITFIPQLYINHLAEKQGEKHLDELIENILLQNNDYKEKITLIFHRINDSEAEIKSQIENFIQLKNEYLEINKAKTSIGNKEKIDDEIKNIAKEIEKLRKSAGFSESQNKTFTDLNTKYKFIDDKKSYYSAASKSVQEFADSISDLRPKINDVIQKKFSEYTTEGVEQYLLKHLYDSINSSIDESFKKFEILSNDYSVALTNKISKLEDIIEDIATNLKPFQEKIKNQKLLENLSKRLKIEKNKIIEINAKTKELNKIVERARQINSEIIENYKIIFDSYIEVESELQLDKYKKISEDLKLQSTLHFDLSKFQSFTGLFDGRSRLSQSFPTAFNDKEEFIFTKDTHLGNIKFIFGKIREIEKLGLRIKTSTTEYDLYAKLLGNYFKIDYKIIYRGDNILKMSPGKRGVVLLELILHISNATHPILIDQPEDNLDNRTIYDELKHFIIDKKKERQIIIVTHNANLVVSTDSENIIVANQSGQQIGKDKREFTFEYVSGGLEKTFINEDEAGILYKYGIREHVCDILEGGKEAFKKREQKYGIE